jgi:hypothetical protein
MVDDRREDRTVCDVVVASDYYGTVRIPGWFREAFHRWAAQPDFPKHVPIRIENGELIVDLRPPGKQLRTYWTDRQSRKPKRGTGE